jgi:hypothetical protein
MNAPKRTGRFVLSRAVVAFGFVVALSSSACLEDSAFLPGFGGEEAGGGGETSTSTASGASGSAGAAGASAVAVGGSSGSGGVAKGGSGGGVGAGTGGTGGSAAGSGGGAFGGSGGQKPAPACSSSFDCPKLGSPLCGDVECEQGVCVTTYEPMGPALGTTGTDGDCKAKVCDGAGNVVEVPWDDAKASKNACAINICVDGELTVEPAAAGTVCSQHGKQCDAAGGCTVPSPDGPNCSSKVDCDKIAAAPCNASVCDDGTCVVKPTAKGSLATDEKGNCLKIVCDGQGQGAPADDDKDPADDGNFCTLDTCAAGQNVHTPKPTGHPCKSNGNYCDSGAKCVACPTPNLQCADYGVGEPNNDEGKAYPIGYVGDVDSQGFTVCGVLSGAGDVDWYQYDGSDGFGVVDPTQGVTSVLGTELCTYAKCKSGTVKFTCPDDTTPATSPSGLPGCCAATSSTNQGFQLLGSTCLGTVQSDSMSILMSVGRVAGSLCTPYQLEFHF